MIECESAVFSRFDLKIAQQVIRRFFLRRDQMDYQVRGMFLAFGGFRLAFQTCRAGSDSDRHVFCLLSRFDREAAPGEVNCSFCLRVELRDRLRVPGLARQLKIEPVATGVEMSDSEISLLRRRARSRRG